MSDPGADGTPAPAPAADDSPSGLPGKQSAAKDKNCPFCGQAFTSSSLGRHLDLYVKEKNPKPPDGIHDVDAIRKMRSGITRRQPRGSLARRDSAGNFTSTPPASTKKPSPSVDGNAARTAHDASTPARAPDTPLVVDQQAFKYPFQPTWEATGVILDIPTPTDAADRSMVLDDDASQDSHMGRRVSHSTHHHPHRSGASRSSQKAQLDARHRTSDAMDTARAAELALREVLSSWRAAKQHIDMNSQPFDFDPLSLDFPALTLQCLRPPPTLFSSIPHPTSTSWSIEPPSEKQREALRVYFQEHFQRWKSICASATTAANEDLSYPPLQTLAPDVRESVLNAEKSATVLEAQVSEHVESMYQIWNDLAPDRKRELWIVELARGIGRRQKEVDAVKEQRRLLQQENANLKSQVEQLNRLQQPREFRVSSPATIPIEESIVAYMFGNPIAMARRGIGLDGEARHMDLNTVVSVAIERWKSVIVSSRSQGMAAQRPLDQSISVPAPISATVHAPSRVVPTQKVRPATQQSSSKAAQSRQMQQQRQQQHQQQEEQQTASNVSVNETSDTAPSATATPVLETSATPVDASNNDSDEDADADMDEDESYHQSSTVKTDSAQQHTFGTGQSPQQHRQNTLQEQHDQRHASASQTKGVQPRPTISGNNQYMVNGSGDSRRPTIPNMGMAVSMQQQPQQAIYNGFGVGGGTDGDPMYMD
ncbi:hypothetical protein Micbo1qcDRAFT_196502 [Microdochium bolleyi]|uniref:Uncharacterized protein n=1 Tax=Microdochium bolleyi TaxID=196109 RepID=A0A136IY70_9PEZI|nr:hypothetical protein Micbo1qcDRAFT_196502 [Microdochium bolleyi]